MRQLWRLLVDKWQTYINILRPKWNSRYFADDTFFIFFKVFLNENHLTLIQIFASRSQLTICQHWFRQWIGANQSGKPLHYSDVIMDATAFQITSLTIVFSTVYSRRRSKKASKLRVTGLCAGNSPGTGEFLVQRVSNAENVSIWWRHHDLNQRWPSLLYASLGLEELRTAYITKPNKIKHSHVSRNVHAR